MFMPIWTETALPSMLTTVFAFMYQPKLPVENCLTSASISCPLIETVSGAAVARNCVSVTGQEVFGGMAGVLALLKRQMGECRDDERVIDTALADRGVALGERRGLDVDHLGALEPLGRRLDGVAREERVQVVRHARRVRRDPAERLPVRGRVAGLLGELARGGLGRGLARVDHAAWNLGAALVRADPELADQDDTVLGGQ